MSQWEAQGINLNLRVQLHDKLADYNKALNEGLSDAAMLRLGLYFLQKMLSRRRCAADAHRQRNICLFHAVQK